MNANEFESRLTTETREWQTYQTIVENSFKSTSHSNLSKIKKKKNKQNFDRKWKREMQMKNIFLYDK